MSDGVDKVIQAMDRAQLREAVEWAAQDADRSWVAAGRIFKRLAPAILRHLDEVEVPRVE